MNKILQFLVLISVLVSSCNAGNRKSNEVTAKIPVIFDTDANNELDDQHALAYLLMNGGIFDVRGVTVNTTFGGGNIDQQYAEAERVMRLCDRFPGIPLWKGANGNFNTIKMQLDSSVFDGSDAVNFIISEARKHSPAKKLTLIMVGKLSNAALAICKDSSIVSALKIVWLGSNYPDPGEYNLENDTVALNYLLHAPVEFEMVTVRYGKPGGTDAVKVTMEEIKTNMTGKGPQVQDAVMGRHNKAFHCFGDYSVNLFENAEMYGNPPSRALFDMAAVAIVKNPSWAQQKTIPCPVYSPNGWMDQPSNSRKIVIWENFNKEAIVSDFFAVMNSFKLVDKVR